MVLPSMYIKTVRGFIGWAFLAIIQPTLIDSRKVSSSKRTIDDFQLIISLYVVGFCPSKKIHQCCFSIGRQSESGRNQKGENLISNQ